MYFYPTKIASNYDLKRFCYDLNREKLFEAKKFGLDDADPAKRIA